MARTPKPQEPEPPQQDRSIYDVPKDFGLIDYIASKNNLAKWCEPVELEQKVHALSLRADGWTNQEICKGLGITRATLEIWEQTDDLYGKTIEFITDMQANDLEQTIWRKAITNNNADIVAMFALKKAKPEYRENSLPQQNGIVTLRISLNGQDLDTSANYKQLKAVNSDDDD